MACLEVSQYFDYQNMGQSENKRRSTTTHTMPIACRVCNRIFYDNVSLVLHFESHLKVEMPTLEPYDRTLTSLQSNWPFSLNSSHVSCSHVDRFREACHIEIPRTTDYSGACFLPVFSADKPKMVSACEIPVLNSMPPSSPSSHAQQTQQQPNSRSTKNKKTTTSTKSQKTSMVVGSSSAVPLNKKTGRRRFSKYQNPQVMQSERPYKEIINISDDEKDDKNPVDMLDLTLRL